MSKLRVTVSYRFAIIAVCLMISSSLTACKADSNYFTTANASIGGSDGSSSDGNAGFRVRLKAKTGVSGLMHKFGDIATACEITLTEIATGTPTSIQCMLNMMEYDLWFYGFEYEFNVPKNTCEYATVTPNYHYRAETGIGPVAGTLSTTDGNINSCVVDGVAGAVTGGYCVTAEGKVSDTGTVICNYDHKQLYPDESTAPNCCLGTGNIVVAAGVTDPSTGNVVVTSRTVKTTYGGHAYNCAQSPHDFIETWPKGVESKKAITYITELGTSALVRAQKIPSSETLAMSAKRYYTDSNFINAGFHDWATYAASPSTWDTARTIPRAFVPEFDAGPTGNHLLASGASSVASAGDGSEDFRCLGGAGEVKYRIRLYTNEWNTIEDYNAYVAGDVASGASPTVTGVVGVNCSAVNVGQSCNTIWGFEDMLNDAGGGLAAYVFPFTYEASTPP